MDTETAEVESPQTESEFSIENASTDDLRNALGITPTTEVNQEVPTQEAQPEEQIPEPEAEGQEPQAEGQEPQEEAVAPETDDEEGKLGKRRVRPRNELDQQVIDLYRSEGFQGSFADASRIIYGQQAPQPTQQNLQPNQEVEASEPDPFQGIDKQADDVRAAILELEGKVEKAAEELETTEALKLQREIMKQELQLQNLTLRKEQMQRSRNSKFIKPIVAKRWKVGTESTLVIPICKTRTMSFASSSMIMCHRLRTTLTTPQFLTHLVGRNY